MKKTLIFLIAFYSLSLVSQVIPSYYDDVNLNLTGLDLKQALSQKIISTHSTTLTYSQVWNVLQEADINPSNNNNVLLIYGWDDTDTDITNDLNRDKYDNGGNVGDWNREHTYAKSLGTPDLGTSGPGADAHNLRASDVQRNGSRGNKKFASATLGTPSGAVGANWFPGNEWRGDVARIIMYMYLRYQNQCKPSNVCVGNPVNIDLNMVDLLLTWNAIDAPDNFEEHRNEIIQQNQGNRNPFIDNPYLATLIWGGNPALNKWNLSRTKEIIPQINIYPNPIQNQHLYLSNLNIDKNQHLEIYNVIGNKVFSISTEFQSDIKIELPSLPNGTYFLKINTGEAVLSKKIILL